MKYLVPSWEITIDSQDGSTDENVKQRAAHTMKGEYQTCRGYEYVAGNTQKRPMLDVDPDKKEMNPNEDRRSREAECWRAESWHVENADCGNRMKCRVEVSPEGVAGIDHCWDNTGDFSGVRKSRSCRRIAGRVVEEIVSCTVEPPT